MAKKNIQLILNQATRYLGQAGEIIDVSPGYARNFLLPNKIAEPITLGRMQYISKLKVKAIQIQEEKVLQMTQLKNQIESINKFSIKRKISENNTIFGSITEKDIIQVIKDTTGTSIERSQVKVPEIKEIGLYLIKLDLMENLSLDIQLQVLPETLS
jgi:large subunit ribosomal protein L9